MVPVVRVIEHILFQRPVEWLQRAKSSKKEPPEMTVFEPQFMQKKNHDFCHVSCFNRPRTCLRGNDSKVVSEGPTHGRRFFIK